MNVVECNKLFEQFSKQQDDARKEFRLIWDIREERFVFVSLSVNNILGYTVDEIMDKKFWDLLLAESIKKMFVVNLSKLLRFINGERHDSVTVWQDEIAFVCKNGEVKQTVTELHLGWNPDTSSFLFFAVSRVVAALPGWCKILEETTDIVRGYGFEKFTLYGPHMNTPVKWRTKKAEELAAFLFHMQKTDIKKEEICEALWPESSMKKCNNALHMSIYWVKKAMLDAHIHFSIHYKNGFYHITPPNMFSDIYIFDEIIYSRAGGIQISEDVEIWRLKKAVALYTQDYMAANDYPWATEKKEYYHLKYLKICKELVKSYFKEKNYKCAREIVEKMLNVDLFSEDAHEFMLKLYIAEDDRANFIKHYKKLKKILYKELGVSPRESIERLYKEFGAAHRQ